MSTFDKLAFWLFPRSIQVDDPDLSASRMRAAGATDVFIYLSQPMPSEKLVGDDERQRRIERLIDACRRVELTVHGCFCEMKFTAQPVAWHQRHENGERAPLLCAANPEVVGWVLARLRSYLDRYLLDGINLEDSYIYQCTATYDPANSGAADYVVSEVCCCDYCRTHAPREAGRRQQWKEAAVTELVGQVAAECRRRGLPISAAARLPYGREFYEPYRDQIRYWDGWGFCQSRANFCADWVAWHAGGLIDFVCPMSYLHDTRIVELHTREARHRIAAPQRNVWMGLGLAYITAEWQETRRPETMNDAARIDQQLAMLAALGQHRVVFFAYDREWVTDDHLRVMAAARGLGPS